MREHKQTQTPAGSASTPLCLDFVLPSKHIIDLGQVIGTRNNAICASHWRKVLLEMSLLAKDAHLQSS